MHGYDIIRELEALHHGHCRPSPGSVYPTLQMLEDAGYVTSQTHDGKRVYEITEQGRTLLNERPEQEHSYSDEFAEDVAGIRDSARKLIEAMRQAFNEVRPELRERICAILDGARREIYTILAEEK